LTGDAREASRLAHAGQAHVMKRFSTRQTTTSDRRLLSG